MDKLEIEQLLATIFDNKGISIRFNVFKLELFQMFNKERFGKEFMDNEVKFE